MVDANAVRTNQAFLIGLSVAAFILGTDRAGGWIVLGVGVVMALGTADRRAALFQQIYHRLLRPSGLVRPDRRQESATPHQFAQALGSIFTLAAGLLLLFSPVGALGWLLVWIVILLAAVNLFAGFCVGCFLYLQLDQRGLLPSRFSDRARASSAAP